MNIDYNTLIDNISIYVIYDIFIVIHYFYLKNFVIFFKFL